ncbi:uncharacterized protein LOC112599924 [Melanaphis sacchari]|uniref:uncharacterized protein LOC112599924 n=1 Tax=Melanaphis sacchari TaxID=742174 RepID=UPI000DC14004|nr:uncharacterized protein LOC112599924 [Melanaphis sacchari]
MFKFYLNKLKFYLEIIVSITLSVTCIYNFLNSPTYVCFLISCNGELSTSVKSAFPRLIAIACLVSKITDMFKNLTYYPKYNKKIEEYELYFPIIVSKKSSRNIFIIFIGFAYISIILPLNIIRLYLIYYNLQKINTLIFFTLMYLQNLSICLIEIYFIVRCFGLFQKFQTINEELALLKSKTITKNKYPAVLLNEVHSRIINNSQCHTLVNSIELLRMKHQFVRSALRDLNKLYGTQMGSSLVYLFIMVLFDIYGEVITKDSKTRSKIFIYGWLLQYAFRCLAIIITTHFTTKQAYSSKMLIADINNRYLDKTTKEELYLFFNQIYHHSVEFTSCDFFTLHPHLITTAFAIGTTYLVVLLQIH